MDRISMQIELQSDNCIFYVTKSVPIINLNGDDEYLKVKKEGIKVVIMLRSIFSVLHGTEAKRRYSGNTYLRFYPLNITFSLLIDVTIKARVI